MKPTTTITLAILAVTILGTITFGISRQSKATPKSTAQTTVKTTTSGTSSSNTSSSDPQDVIPGLYTNPIQNTATQEGFTIGSVAIENNTDAKGRVVNDHLEFSLKNTTGSDLTNFTIYYTMNDMVTHKKEGYSKLLTGFTLKTHDTQTLHFDGNSGTNHFSINKENVYYKSTNKVHFEITISTPGYKVQTAQIDKSEGGAETKD